MSVITHYHPWNIHITPHKYLRSEDGTSTQLAGRKVHVPGWNALSKVQKPIAIRLAEKPIPLTFAVLSQTWGCGDPQEEMIPGSLLPNLKPL